MYCIFYCRSHISRNTTLESCIVFNFVKLFFENHKWTIKFEVLLNSSHNINYHIFLGELFLELWKKFFAVESKNG